MLLPKVEAVCEATRRVTQVEIDLTRRAVRSHCSTRHNSDVQREGERTRDQSERRR